MYHNFEKVIARGMTEEGAQEDSLSDESSDSEED